MKHIYKRLLTVLLLVQVYAISIYSTDIIKHERLLSFEDKNVPAFIKGQSSKLSLSTLHYKDGKQSLEWEYQPDGTLSLRKDLHFESKDPTGSDTYLSTFTVWIYNAKANDEKIEFQFLKDGKLCASFPFNIDFEGWRAAYVSYERDMDGMPEEGMNEIVIKAPHESGKLYFDMLVTAAKADHRHHTADIHQPFVNKGIANHWLTIYQNSLIQPDDALYKSQLSDKDIEEIAKMENRLRELIITPVKVSDKLVSNLEERFEKFRIKEANGVITGLPLFYIYYVEIFERIWTDYSSSYHRQKGQEFRDYFNLMQQIANAYANAREVKHLNKLRDIFLKMYDHAKDQGVAYGSNMGNFTHYGYSFRGFFTSYFLMKDVLKETGRLEESARALQWYAQTNETFIRPVKNGIDMDSFNTLSMGRICSILIMEDSPEKAQYIRAFSRWIDTGCKPSPGLDGAFKADGSAVHHRNNYPAYAVGGLDGATNMIYILSRTSFAVSELGHKTVKNVLSIMRFYCNTTHFPLSMSGRHPDGKGELVPIHYARMAVAGTPDGKQDVDRDMASAYMRLVAVAESGEQPEYMPEVNKVEQNKMLKLFNDYGIVAEPDPQGNIVLPYGNISVQRRSNWSAVVRGHSRYLWAAEHYRGANLYGRYLAHGSMQIMTAEKNERVTPASSGWIQEGFDWGRIPGATAIHLPVEQLQANVLNVDKYSGYEEMLFSDESFSGGLSQNKTNGIFAMKLHEHDKYNGSHRARKSFHFFDNRIICLGSDIQNANTDYNTETTVFQLAVLNDVDKHYWNNYKSDNEYWIDHLGTGYFIPKKKTNAVVFEKNFPQKSRYQNSGKENSGDWVNLVLDHGKAPKGLSYEYVVLPQTYLGKKDKNTIRNSYEVIQHDQDAHIVKDRLSKTTSFVFFETPQSLPKSIISYVDTTCLIMLKEGKANVVDLTVANPDLALYRGGADEIYDALGKRVERSIYSRPWISNESQEVPVTVTLNGEWAIVKNDGFIQADVKEGQTILIFKCKGGTSINVELKRVL